jgi:16S rRNA (adenine1518-N6/adenine1519-N6)-dimethyltransferase
MKKNKKNPFNSKDNKFKQSKYAPGKAAFSSDGDVRAKKHLGQHFLTDEGIASKIADTLGYEGYKNVLEIGPGMGVLTKYLL